MGLLVGLRGPHFEWEHDLRGRTSVVLAANPAQYDIDAALIALDRIWWRVPQHTSEIHVGDVAILWRSGRQAGVVGLGRVCSDPALHQGDPAERSFVLAEEEAAADATRALVRARSVPFVSKDQVRALPDLERHQIVLAPMGTVFAVSEVEWAALQSLLPEPPELLAESGTALPAIFAWPQRAKGVLPMPGGYNGYLASLRKVRSLISEERPTPGELASRLESVLGVKAAAARLRESFLRKIGIVTVQGGACSLGPWTDKWMASNDHRIMVALLHARCQFIGEMLAAASSPSTNEGLLAVANDHYGMGWDTQTQIVNRRGWLQSAGMLEDAGDSKVMLSDFGRLFLAEIELYDPREAPPVITITDTHPGEPLQQTEAPRETGAVGEIVDALRSSATDSSYPDHFEVTTRDAFAFLGFHAQWLGGSGRTDVLLDAPLGAEDAYRVVVDCKTSASGSVGDQQVDWETLTEHKAKHDADYILLVAPNPSGSRLLTRAAKNAVTVMSADQLGGLCRQHAKTPLGLDDYRSLFAPSGTIDTEAVDERAEEVERLTRLAAALCSAIRDKATAFGRLSARDLFLILSGQAVAEGTAEDELQTLLDALASPLLGVLHTSSSSGYRVTTSPQVVQRRVEMLARELSGKGGDRSQAADDTS
jgi:hypothetical protein